MNYVVVSPENMTSNNLPEPYVTKSSTVLGGYQPFYLFGGTAAQYYHSTDGDPKCWVVLDLGESKRINGIIIKSNPANYQNTTPKDIEILGSDDDNDYSLIATISNQTGWVNNEERTFMFKSVRYRYYKLSVLANNGHTATRIGKLKYIYDKSYDLKMIINYNGVYKTYDEENKSLVDFTDNISELLNEDSESTFISDLNDIRDLIDLKSPQVKIISNKNFKTSLKTIKSTKQLFIASGDFSTKLAEHIDYFKFQYNISDEDCIIRVSISIDSGKTWKTCTDDEWINLDNTVTNKNYDELSTSEKVQWDKLLDEILSKGIDVKNMDKSLDFNNIENMEKARFVYAIQINNANSEAILKNLQWQFDSIGKYTQLNTKTEVNINMTNNAISVQPLKNIDLMKINIGISSNKIDIDSLSDNDLKKLKEKINNV